MRDPHAAGNQVFDDQQVDFSVRCKDTGQFLRADFLRAGCDGLGGWPRVGVVRSFRCRVDDSVTVVRSPRSPFLNSDAVIRPLGEIAAGPEMQFGGIGVRMVGAVERNNVGNQLVLLLDRMPSDRVFADAGFACRRCGSQLDMKGHIAIDLDRRGRQSDDRSAEQQTWGDNSKDFSVHHHGRTYFA